MIGAPDCFDKSIAPQYIGMHSNHFTYNRKIILAGMIYASQYGHIEIRLKESMDKNGLTRNALARAVNTRFEVIDKWYNGHVEKIDTDVLARICFVLDCTPGDIVRYALE